MTWIAKWYTRNGSLYMVGFNQKIQRLLVLAGPAWQMQLVSFFQSCYCCCINTAIEPRRTALICSTPPAFLKMSTKTSKLPSSKFPTSKPQPKTANQKSNLNCQQLRSFFGANGWVVRSRATACWGGTRSLRASGRSASTAARPWGSAATDVPRRPCPVPTVPPLNQKKRRFDLNSTPERSKVVKSLIFGL